MRTILFAALTAATLAPIPSAVANGAGFDPRVITFGETREQIKSTPVTERPYRPLHFYGNSVRRRHSRAPAAGQRMVQSR